MSAFHLIQNPAGTFHFVGNVPAKLAFEFTDEQDVINASVVGSGMAAKIAANHGRKLATRTFETREAGEAAAQAYGNV